MEPIIVLAFEGRTAMSSNGNIGRDVVELWGREFNIVRTGLSEAQVVSFVNELVKQHDVLLQRQEHLATLTRLAERTVSEADKLAEDIKIEARKQAEDEAAKLIADAETTASTQSASVLADARARAEEEAKEIGRQKMSEAEDTVRRMIADAESRGRHILEQKEAEAQAHAETKARAILKKAQEDATSLLERERQKIQPELDQFVNRFRGQLLSELDLLKNQVGSMEPHLTTPPHRKDAAPGKKETRKERPDEFLDLVGGSDSGESGDPEWEIEIVPPIDIMKIMSIVAHLDAISEVSKTEIIPRNDGTSIMVYCQGDIELADSLRSLPEVSEAEETTAGGTAKPRKLMLALSVNGGSSGSADELLSGEAK
jgi:F0F1-type ATP synthase membrane subunit b/b'